MSSPGATAPAPSTGLPWAARPARSASGVVGGRWSWVLVGLSGLLPYVTTIKLPPSPSFWGEMIAVVLACAFLISLRPRSRVPGASSSVAVPTPVLGCLAFGAALLLQLALQQPLFRGAAVLTLLALVLAARICIAGARVREAGESARLLDALSIGLLVALALNALAVAAERQGVHVYIYQIGYRAPPARAEGLVGQPNQLAAFAAMASLAANYLWMRGRLAAVLHAMFALLTGFVIAATGSRAGAIVWCLGAVLSVLAMRTHPRRRVGFALVGVGLAAMLLAQVLVPLAPLGAGDATAGLALARGEARGRIELWRDSWALIQHHPLAGVGYGNFMAARWNELSGTLQEPNANQAHNLVLQLAVELGLPLAALVLVPVGMGAWRCVRAATRRSTAPEQFLPAGIALTLAAYAMVEYPLWYLFFLLPFALCLGLVDQRSRRVPVSGIPPVGRAAGWALVAAFCVALAVDYRRSESLFTTLVDQVSSGQPVRIDRREAVDANAFTAFDTYANLMYARTLTADGFFMGYKLEVNERAMLTMTNHETIGRQVAFLVADGKPDEARALLARTRRGDDLEALTRGVLKSMAPTNPAIATFVSGLPPIASAPPAR